MRLSGQAMQPVQWKTRPRTARLGDSRWKDTIPYAVLGLTVCLLLLWIRPQYSGDPADYASQAFTFLERPSLAATRAVFEFGHLIWRPAAVAATVLCGPAISGWMHIEPRLVPLVGLIALNAIFTLLAVLLVYRIARCLSGSVLAATVVALLFVTTNAVFTYMRSGYSYLPGVAMQLLAVSIIVAPAPTGNAPRSRLRLRAFLLGCALAVSICLWAPYVVSVPGVIAFALLWEKGGLPHAARLRLAMQATLWMAVATGLAFGGAILVNQFRSWEQIAQWIRNSSHEWAQTQRLARLVTGLPRAFIAVQDESLMLKRLYFHDPYAPVTWARLLAAVAWKPPLFAVAIGALGWILAKTAGGRRLLIANLCCWTPLIVFAVTVFEPGAPERFLPGFALLFAGIAYASGRISWRDAAAWALAVFFVAMVAVNISSVTPAAREARDQNAVARLEAFRKVWRPNDLLVLLWFRDPIFRFQNVDPFHPLNRTSFRVLDAIEPGTLRGLRFRQEFAAEAVNAWHHGGDVWISQRLIAERPRPEWDWVEGDNGARWRDLSSYYRQFETDAETGGEDGFLRIAASQTNRLLLGPHTVR